MRDGDGQPMATYRLQINKDFRFTDAQGLIQYFSRLGITHIYASPILRARHSSSHSYDVVDPKTINPNLGDETDLINLVADLRNFGLGLVLDIVPNHMAASIENPYWRDVLTYGHSSPFAGWFDIDWRMPDPDMWGRVLVPVLGAPRSHVLKQDEIRLVWADGRFLVQYFEHVFPVDPATVPTICAFGWSDLKECLPAEHPALDKIAEILARLKKLPKLAARLRRRVDIDREETEQWLAQFAQMVVQSPRIDQWAEETAQRFGQGEEGRRRLKKLLDSQPYRLVHWRDAARTINYRRFFDINELISIRQEDPHVFDETHAAVLRWVNDGLIDGLRIDHIDGLRDPLGYLERLTEALAQADRPHSPLPVFVEKILAADEKLPCGWPVAGTTGYEFLNQLEAIFVSPAGFADIEKLYLRTLRRPVSFEQVANWGKRRVLRSDLAPQVGRLADTLLRLSEKTSHMSSAVTAGAEVSKGKLAGVRQESLAASSVGAGQAGNGTRGAPGALVSQPELTQRDFVDAIVEVITALPVYRTYVDSNYCVVNDADRRYVERALQDAHRSGRAAPEAVDFLGEVLLLDNRSALAEHELNERVNFIQRMQQVTGPAAAKGVEDTAIYAYVPLISLNEVGGEPHLPSDPPGMLHQANEERASTHPQTMLGVTTHDTKRTADVRARLDVLSEIPKLWSGLVRRWQRLNRRHRSRVRGRHAPDATTEHLFYQTVVGIWPAPDPRAPDQLPAPDALTDLRERVKGYMLKAVREAKTHTSWTNNNRPYEEAVLAFVENLLPSEQAQGTPFLSDVQNLAARIARPGFWNSLSRTLIQFTAPGTPDLYQGDELWNFALVDPDNRRAVNYEQRQRLLDEVITAIEGPEEARGEFIRSLVDAPEDGRIKLHVIRSLLVARREHPHLFAASQYIPLETEGSAKHHILAFARMTVRPDASSNPAHASDGSVGQAAITVAPRLTAGLVSEPTAAPLGEEAWADTLLHLPGPLQDRSWTCALTRRQFLAKSGSTLRVAEILEAFPGSLLVAEA